MQTVKGDCLISRVKIGNSWVQMYFLQDLQKFFQGFRRYSLSWQ